MIDGYKIKDGKVIVVNYDDQGEVTQKERDYQDNIEELLIAENLSEHLDNLKREALKDINDCEKKIFSAKKNISDSKTSVVIFICCGGILCLAKPWIPLLACFLGAFIINGKSIVSMNKKIKEANKEIEGKKLYLEGIEEQIKKNQRDLRRLRNDDRKECDNLRNGYRQFDLVQLEEMNNYLSLWYFIGKNEKDCLWHQSNNYLIDYFKENHFNDEERKTLKRILNRNNRR